MTFAHQESRSQPCAGAAGRGWAQTDGRCDVIEM